MVTEVNKRSGVNVKQLIPTVEHVQADPSYPSASGGNKTVLDILEPFMKCYCFEI